MREKKYERDKDKKSTYACTMWGDYDGRVSLSSYNMKYTWCECMLECVTRNIQVFGRSGIHIMAENKSLFDFIHFERLTLYACMGAYVMIFTWPSSIQFLSIVLIDHFSSNVNRIAPHEQHTRAYTCADIAHKYRAFEQFERLFFISCYFYLR